MIESSFLMICPSPTFSLPLFFFSEVSLIRTLPPPSFNPSPLSLFPSPHFLHLFPSMRLAELAAVWPKSPATGTTLEGAGPSTNRPPVRVCVFACVLVCACVRWCVQLATRLHTCFTHARLASSAWSGLDWMMGTLLALAVSVIQTPNRSHRLQQAPPLSIKANPLSPARWRWSND